MKPKTAARFNRRDFLRLAGLAPLGLVAPRWSRRLASAAGRPNAIVLIFDALSARNLSLHGYPRQTMPNLNRLAERAIVYHNHYATSNFTTPGAASLLTGTLPWTNRALLAGGRVARTLVDRNVFQILDDYYSIAYTHNAWAQVLLTQFADFIDESIPRKQLFLATYDGNVPGLFPADDDEAGVAWARYLKPDQGHAYSLFLSQIYDALHRKQLADYAAAFPRGLPMTTAQEPFLLEDAVGWLSARLPQVPQPFLAYLHFLPPHEPYTTSAEFFQRFAGDGLPTDAKPRDAFIDPEKPYDAQGVLDERTQYDEFLLYADKALGAFYEALDSSGLLENTWLLFTSDHGEMFERGIVGHGSPVLYEPAIRVPLLMLEPGRTERLDIQDFTSALDIVPTLAHLAGHAIPDWVEGQVLPPFAPADASRALYAVHARENDPFRKLYKASVMMLRDGYKLQSYFGYQNRGIRDFVRLYDIRNDPEELKDLTESRADVSQKMLGELKAKLAEVNKPYRRGS